MIKLKDIIWGELDLTDEFSLSYDLNDTESEDEINSGEGNTVTMCCGGIGRSLLMTVCGK